MKIPATFTVLLVLALAFSAGCTGQQTPPQTTATTITMTPTPVPTVATPAVPADLAQSWTLTIMATQNGSAILRPTKPATITFWTTGALNGYSGCNNYNAPFTLSGEMTPKGKAISVGPIVSTLMYCEAVADQETMYYGILQRAAAYTINGDKLTITASDGTSLSFNVVKP